MTDLVCNKKLLLLEDDEVFRDVLTRSLLKQQILVTAFSSINALREVFSQNLQFDYVVLDLKLPDGLGSSLVKDLRAKYPESKIIIMTGFGSIANAVQAVQDGADDYISKPIDSHKLLAILENSKSKDLPKVEVPSLDQVEWEHIQRVLQDCSGNISKAAKLLGLERRSLQRKIQRLAPN